VFKCPRCGEFSITSSRRYGRCPYCGSLTALTPARVIASFDRAREASEYVRRLKSKKVDLDRLGFSGKP